jgi:hypothetical protein
MIKLRYGMLVKPQQDRQVIRGELEPETLADLETDWYQRGKVNPKKIKELMDGIENNSDNIPDLTLGMRGTKYEIANDGVILHDPVFIIDGLQRWTASMLLMERPVKFLPYLGIKAFVPSDINFELGMFRDLNSKRTSMSASVLLRNEKEYSRVAATLWGLSQDEKFALNGRVAWDQQVDKTMNGQLIRGIVLLDVIFRLHSHVDTVVFQRGNVIKRIYALEKNIDAIGLQRARENLTTFFNIIDECWGITGAQLRYNETFLTQGWLMALAKLLSDHREFWRDDLDLQVPANHMRDLKRIKWSDPKLEMLARGNATSQEHLKSAFLDIMNKGKSTGRLVDRYTLAAAEMRAERKQYYGNDPARL